MWIIAKRILGHGIYKEQDGITKIEAIDNVGNRYTIETKETLEALVGKLNEIS